MLKTVIVSLALLASSVAAAAEPRVELKTNMGTIVLELYPDRAPETVKNFQQYVESGHYNGTVFHRDPGEPDWTQSELGSNRLLPGVQAQSLLWTGSGWVVGTSSGVFLSPTGTEPWALSSLGRVPILWSALALRCSTVFAAFDERAVSTYISPPLLTQAIVHELFERSAFRPNLDRIRGILREQRDAMLTALDDGLAGRATWNRPNGGYFLWVDFEGGIDAGDLLARAIEAGVTFVRGSDFFPGASGGTSSARFAFSYEPPERIAEGIRILAGLL